VAHVLIIDDNRSVRLTLEYCVQQLGHTATLAEDGRTGLKFAAESEVDVVLVDVHMPVMDGFAVCEAIKKNSSLRHLTVVMMTACPTRETVARATEAGALGVLSKPFSLEQLQAAITRQERIDSSPADENSVRNAS
jgi:CheY-like chemotaxis protein